jgi:hypothetical protein
MHPLAREKGRPSVPPRSSIRSWSHPDTHPEDDDTLLPENFESQPCRLEQTVIVMENALASPQMVMNFRRTLVKRIEILECAKENRIAGARNVEGNTHHRRLTESSKSYPSYRHPSHHRLLHLPFLHPQLLIQ